MAQFGKMVGFVHKHMQIIAAIGLGFGAAGSVIPQTYGLSYYQRMLSHYKDNEPVPIDNDLTLLIDKVVARVNLQPELEVKLKFITSFPSDPIHKGSIRMRTGALIGLPATFAYHSIDDIDRKSVLLEQRFFDWTSPAAESLLDSLILSDKAKAFVIARETRYASAFSVHVDFLLRTMFGMLAYWSGYALNKTASLTYRLKPWARFSVFSLIASSWFLMYVVINDAYYCWQDNRADRYAARLGRVYAEGGVEYYNRVLQRNQAMRKLLRAEGEKKFTKFGNDVILLRTPHVQLTSRRDNLVKYLKEYDSAQSETAKNVQMESELASSE